jgi:hypothetical protein
LTTLKFVGMVKMAAKITQQAISLVISPALDPSTVLVQHV